MWRTSFIQFEGGRLDEEIWVTMVARFSDLMAMRAFPAFWGLRKHVYAKGFSAFVDGIEVGEYKLSAIQIVASSNLSDWKAEADDYVHWSLGDPFSRTWWDGGGKSYFDPELSNCAYKRGLKANHARPCVEPFFAISASDWTKRRIRS